MVGLNVEEVIMVDYDWALRTSHKLMSSNSIIFDTETTGLRVESNADHPGSEIIELAVMDTAGVEMIETLIYPTQPPDPGTMEFVHLDVGELFDAPTFDMIYPYVNKVLFDSEHVIAYNVSFDAAVLRNTYRIYKYPTIPLMLDWKYYTQYKYPSQDTPIKWNCAMLLYSAYKGILNDWGSYKWYKLEEAAEEFGCNHTPHRAMDDVRMVYCILESMAELAERRKLV